MESGDARVDVDVGAATLACLVAGDGPVVIAAHGFPDCARSFRHQLPALVGAGFRVVRPYLRGYAPSTVARDGRYDAAALGDDLVALARYFSPGAPARLIGHDWGAIAAYAASALAPAAFSQLVTIAVPHLRVAAPRFVTRAQIRRSWYIALFQLRGVAERLLRAHDFALVDRLWREWSPGFTPPRDELSAIKGALVGRERDLLAYYRALPWAALTVSAQLLRRRTRVPALYIHGLADGCIGVGLSDGIERAYAEGIRAHRLDGGHFVHQGNPKAVNRILVEFLSPATTR